MVLNLLTEGVTIVVEVARERAADASTVIQEMILAMTL